MEKFHCTQLDLIPINDNPSFLLGVLSLNRPEAANSFSAEVMDELIMQLEQVRSQPLCRALVLTGKGKHFSAGADLAWMQKSADLSYEQNLTDAKKLISLMEQLYQLPIPTVAYVRGAAFGGALGLIAACDYALATKDARFCLSEVKLGILPAVILPYLAKKILPGALRRLSLSARLFSAEEALAVGLIEKVADNPLALRQILLEELNLLLAASGDGQRNLKNLHHFLCDHSFKQNEITARTIAEARVSPAGQLGLKSFLNKQTPSWVVQITEEVLKSYEL